VGLVAANHVLGNVLTTRELAALASEIEGHADNVLPALVGGLVVVATTGMEAEWMKIDCPPALRVALAVPELRISTSAAREVLPERVPFEDAIHNVSRVGLLVAAVQNDRLDLLATAMDDRLHEPYRRRLHPALDAMLAAARKAGARGAALSGSGSTVIALCEGDAQPAATAMRQACEEAGIECRDYVCMPSTTGAEIVSE
jgi:homoserine kinase